ncbi:hypothetical protein ACS0TY_016323 [Phlomoides rotata]
MCVYVVANRITETNWGKPKIYERSNDQLLILSPNPSYINSAVTVHISHCAHIDVSVQSLPHDTHAEMKVIAAYLLAVLGGNASPSAEDLKGILGSVGVDHDNDMIEHLLTQVKGKDITDLIAAGCEKLASVPSGGGAVAVASSAAGVGGGAAASAAAEPKKEEKVEEKEESDDVSVPCILLMQFAFELGFYHDMCIGLFD